MQVGRYELLDERAIAALRFLDAVTRLPVRDALEVRGARTTRSASGLIVIRTLDVQTPGMAHYHSRFRGAPQAGETAPVSLHPTLTVTTPGGRYLSRAFTVDLPLQDADPALPDHVFDPIEVTLYPGPAYAVEPLWASIRVRVTRAGTTPAVPLGGVLVSAVTQATPGNPGNPSVVLGRGLSDPRGEALVVVPGLRPATLTAPETTLNLEVRRDNTNPAIPNPDDLLDAAGDEEWLEEATHADVVVAPGRRTVVSISIPEPEP